MKKNSKEYLGIIGLFTATMIWGGGYVASDIALETLSSFQTMAIRFFIASIFTTLVAVKELKSLTKKELKCGITLGITLFAGFALQTVGLEYTTPSNNAFLTATNVVLVPFIAFIFCRKKIEKRSLIGAVMTVAGAGVLSLNANFSIGLGDSLTLLCAVAFAAQIFLTGQYVGKIRPTILNSVQMLTSFVLSIFGCVFEGAQFQPTQRSMAAVLYLGFISTTITYFLQTISQKYVDETKTAIILSTESVFAMVFSVIFLHENVTSRMIAGSVLILSAVLISQLKLPQKVSQKFTDVFTKEEESVLTD